MIIVFTTTLALLGAAGVVTAVAALRGPTSADRMLAVDLLLIVLAAGLATGAALVGRALVLSVVLVVSLVAFVGTVVVGRTLERSGRR